MESLTQALDELIAACDRVKRQIDVLEAQRSRGPSVADMRAAFQGARFTIKDEPVGDDDD